VAVVLACGCGRVGFDATPAPSDGAGSDALAPDGPPAICHTGTWGTPTPIASTVTGSEEADPSISADELTLYFSSNRTPSAGRAIWFATRQTTAEAFGAPSQVIEIDDAMDDLDPALSPPGTELLFASRRSGTLEIYVASRPGATGLFSTIAPLAISGDAVSVRSGPKLTPDRLGLYYARDLNIAFASRADPTADFAFVRELDEINASPTDTGPTITADGLELFFDSYRNGPAAIFTATRPDTGSPFSGLTELTELPMVTNGTAAGSPEISADGRTLYYWISVAGQLDLYTATRSCP
jgi:hypothetical protein